MISALNWQRSALLLVLLYVVIYLLPLGARPLSIPDEMRYAEIPREMLASGDWLSPSLNGLHYFEKPVLDYWLNAVSIAVFGENNFAVRLPSALAAGLTALMVFQLLRRFSGRGETALLGTAIYLTMTEVFFLGTFNTLDGIFTLFITGIFTSFFQAHMADSQAQRRRYLAAMGLFCGLAFLTKGFLAFALPVIVIVPFLIWQKRWGEILSRSWLPLVVAAVVIAPWAIMVHLREADYWHYFFWVEHIQRFTSDNAQHAEPAWYYLLHFPLLAFPWSLQLPAAAAGLTRAGNDKGLVRYLALWLLLPFLFFSASSGKLMTYILPCLPALAMLLALGLERQLSDGKTRLFKLCAWLGTAAVLLPLLYLLLSSFLGVGKPAYGADENSGLIGACLALLISAYCLWRSGRDCGTYTRLSWYAASAVSVCLLWVTYVAMPEQIAERKWPGDFLRQQQSLVTADTLLVADGSMVHSVNWIFKRNDVYLLDGGELSYGLSYPDAHYRSLEGDAFRVFLDRYAGKQPIAIFVRDSSGNPSLGKLIPSQAHFAQHGTFAFWYIPVGQATP